MIRPLSTTFTRTSTLLLLRAPRRAFTTTPPRPRDAPPSIIPPSLKQTAKALDHTVSAAALKGIEVGEKVADATRHAVGVGATTAKSTMDDNTGGVDMYGEPTSAVDAGSGATTASGASAKTAAGEATGKVSELVGEAKGRMKDAAGEAKGQAKKMAGEASGKTSEVVGQAKGKKEEVMGQASGKTSQFMGQAKGKKEEVKGKAKGAMEGSGSGNMGL